MARLVCSTAHVCSATIAVLSFSCQQGNTFARYQGTAPARPRSGAVFYGPALRWDGMLVYPMPGGSCHGSWNGEVV